MYLSYFAVLVQDSPSETNEEGVAEAGGGKRKKNAGKPTKKRKLSRDLRKPPTAKELNLLSQSETQAGSNLFRIQIDDLLKEVTVKDRYRTQFNAWFASLEKFVQEIPEYPDVVLAAGQVKSKGDDGQFGKFAKWLGKTASDAQEVYVKLARPERLAVLEVWDACVGPELKVKVVAVMPQCCFLQKDYLDVK